MNHYITSTSGVNRPPSEAEAELPAYAQRVLSKFPDRQYTGVNSKGYPTWKARCRAHDDDKASLTLSYAAESEYGPCMLAHCFACESKPMRDLLAPVGLAPRDLFDPNHTRENSSDKSPVVIWYDYHDVSGRLVYQVGRREKKEDFPQRHPDKAGGWVWNMHGVRRVLYRLPELTHADPSLTVYIPEGEKDVENLRALGLIATCNPQGAGKWQEDFSPALSGRDVVVLEDNDAPGQAHASKVAKSIRAYAKSVKVLKLPDLPEHGDVSDWLQAGGTREELERLAHEAPEWTQSAPAALPNIIVSDRPLRDKTTDAIEALRHANTPPVLFVRSGRPARIRTDEAGRPLIEPVGDVELANRLTRTADFLKLTEKGYHHVSPPGDVVGDILAMGVWPFPPLEAIVEVPVLRPDGSILSAPGYDPATKLYYMPAPGLYIPPIPTNPSQAERQAAADLIDELLHDFPFVDEASRANAWGLLLTPIVRQATGLAQMALIDAPTPGSGKGLLAAVVSLIATGRHAALINPARDDDEWRKRITSVLGYGSTIINIDNVERRLDSAALCSVLTTEEWSDRVLGRSEQVHYSHRATWIATGNNIQPAGDLPRRCFWIRLDAEMPMPWTREGFKHPALMSWTLDNRGRLLAALLTLARAWYADGKPNGAKLSGVDNFSAWASTVSGILAHAGRSDFLGNATSMFEQLDDDGAQWEAFLSQWQAVWGAAPVTVAEVVTRLKQGTEKDSESDPVGDALRASLPDVLASAFASDKSFSHKLGLQLRSIRDRRFGARGLCVIRADGETSSKKSSKWRVVDYQTGPRRTPPTPPNSPTGNGGNGGNGGNDLCPSYKNEQLLVSGEVKVDVNTVKEGETFPPIPPIPPADITGLLTRAEDLAAALPDLLTAPIVALDTETTGLDPLADRVRLIQMATPAGAVMVDCFSVDPTPLQQVLDSAPVIIGHNLKFDLAFLAGLGLTIADGGRLFDTMLAAQLLEAGTDNGQLSRCGLAAVAERYLGVTLDKSYQKSDWSGTLTADQLTYAAEDVTVLFPLADRLREAVTDAKLDQVLNIEMRALPSLAWLWRSGAPVDSQAWQNLAESARAECADLEAQLNDLTNSKNLLGHGTVKWSSPDQVTKLLEARGHHVKGTGDAELKDLEDQEPLVPLLLAYREASKRAKTYGADFLKHVHPHTGRIHADYFQIGSKAGRMSCSKPNLQQIPRAPAYRACFRPSPGRCLVKADYSQIELRIAAEASKDPRMIQAYQNGEDLHVVTAAAVMGKAPAEVTKADRQAAKALNFGLLYGMGAEGLRSYAKNNYGVTLTQEEAEGFRSRFFTTYPGLKRWHSTRPNETVHTFTIGGRRRLLVDRFTEKLNSPIQGTGADILKLALAHLWETRAEHPTAYPVLVVHDEIVLEADIEDAQAAAAWLVGCMQRAGAAFLQHIPVEVEAKIAADWAGSPLEASNEPA